MKIHEAIGHDDFMSLDRYARPAWWRGSGYAVTLDIDKKHLIMIPALRPIVYNPRVRDILDDWELVEPEVVHEELRKMQSGIASETRKDCVVADQGPRHKHMEVE